MVRFEPRRRWLQLAMKFVQVEIGGHVLLRPAGRLAREARYEVLSLSLEPGIQRCEALSKQLRFGGR